MFFSDSGILTEENRQAKKICMNCICLVDCRTYAVNNDVKGIWGGTHEGERHRLRKKLNITPIPMSMRGRE